MSRQDILGTPLSVQTLNGQDTPAAFGALHDEVMAIRRSVGLSLSPEVAAFRLLGDAAYDVLDRLTPGSMSIRNFRLRSSLLLDESGVPQADLLLGCEDDDFLVLSRGMPAGELAGLLREACAVEGVGVEDLSESHVMLSLEGPFSWSVLAELEDPGIIGFPYLSLFRPQPDRIYLRAGRCGEYGYHFLVPVEQARALTEEILDIGQDFELRRVGRQALEHCALENMVFDIHQQIHAGLSPVELQLQWRTVPGKDYRGSAAVQRHRDAPLGRLTAVESEAPLTATSTLSLNGAPAGRILTAARSVCCDRWIGHALLRPEVAFPGLTLSGPDGAPVQSISAPFVNNLSLFVNPQRHTFADRDRLSAPPLDHRAFRASLLASG